MTQDGSIETDANPLLWQVGWNWLYVLIAGPILAIIFPVVLDGPLGTLLAALAIFGLPGLAIFGLITVRRNVDNVVDNGIETVKGRANEVARLHDQDTESYSLMTEAGESQPLLPKPKRQFATLVVGESLLLVHDSSEIDLPGLSWEVGESTNEYYYDQISGVNYEPHQRGAGGEFWVNLSDGHGQKWTSTNSAEDALAAVQNRIRAYKTQ